MEKVDRNDPGYSSKLNFLIFTFVFKDLQCFYTSMRQVEWTASRARKNKNMQSEASCSMHMLDTNVRCFHNDMRMLRHRMRGLPCWGFYNAIANSETAWPTVLGVLQCYRELRNIHKAELKAKLGYAKR